MDVHTDLLTLPEAAKFLRIQLSTIKAWRLAKKHLPFRKIGGKVLVHRDDIERFIAKSTIKPEAN